MTDTTAQHMAARDDSDLTARLVAAAEQAQIPSPAGFVAANVGRLVSTEIATDTTLTSIHAYAAGQYELALAALPPRPGMNPAAVTDNQLATAVLNVWEPDTA